MAQWSENDREMMTRAVEIAQSGRGHTRANPCVGAVISVNGRIAAEGYHQQHGGPHAERNALAEARRKGVNLREATMYVTLEPCAHHGKTGPCTKAIIDAGVRHVVVGALDPNPLVNGRGVIELQQANIDVKVGLLAAECHALNPAFNTFHAMHRPHVLIKWAQSLDGFIDTLRPPNAPAPWLTGSLGRLSVHKWRAECMAILVGANTILRDNPQLNVRAWVGQQPLRVVVDRNLSIPLSSHLLDGTQPTLIFTNSNQTTTPAFKKRTAIARLDIIPIDETARPAATILHALYKRGVNSLLVEGGAKTIQDFVDANLWDEARIFIAPTCFGKGVAAPPFPQGARSYSRIGQSTLLKIANPYPQALQHHPHDA